MLGVFVRDVRRDVCECVGECVGEYVGVCVYEHHVHIKNVHKKGGAKKKHLSRA